MLYTRGNRQDYPHLSAADLRVFLFSYFSFFFFFYFLRFMASNYGKELNIVKGHGPIGPYTCPLILLYVSMCNSSYAYKSDCTCPIVIVPKHSSMTVYVFFWPLLAMVGRLAFPIFFLFLGTNVGDWKVARDFPKSHKAIKSSKITAWHK